MLSFDTFLKWADESGVDQSPAQLRKYLKDHITRPHISEAILIASPDLAETIPLWIADPESARGQRVEHALVRYFARMTGRPTPFGLFAGVSLAHLAPETRLNIANWRDSQKRVRVDMDYLLRVVDHILQEPSVRDSLMYAPNQSLYELGGLLRYVERSENQDGRAFALVGLSPSSALGAVLEKAQGGAFVHDLARGLVDDDVSLEDAGRFVRELISSQVLVPTVAPCITGDGALQTILADLQQWAPHHTGTLVLADLARIITTAEMTPAGESVDWFRQLLEATHRLPITCKPNRLTQVDLFKPSSGATIGTDVLREVWRGLDMIRATLPAPVDDALSRFRDAFVDKYADWEVPLLEALDDEIGIGFQRSAQPGVEGSPLLAGLAFSTATPRVAWTPRDATLLTKLQRVVREGGQDLSLTDDDVDELAERTNNEAPLPDALSARIAIASKSTDAMRRGDYQLHFIGAIGPPGTRFLGRFCYGDADLRRLVGMHVQKEEALRPDAVFAEIVHILEDRVGNLVCRPVLRQYEIPYLARSGAPLTQQIPLQDLMVSVRDQRVFLRSVRLGCEVIPRLSTAHFAFAQRNLPTYKFLVALQLQGVAGPLSWTWGPLTDCAFLPRVSYGRLVLSAAQWNLTRTQIEGFVGTSGGVSVEAVQALRRHLRLPRIVGLMDGDNQLPIDLENHLSIASFARLVASRKRARVVEMLPKETELLANGDDGRYVHELILPLVRTGAVVRHASPIRFAGRNVPRQQFGPGSPWLYVKIYTGYGLSDAILKDVVGPLARRFTTEGECKRWFFVRYADPDYHLRVRFEGEPSTLWTKVFPVLRAALEEHRGGRSVSRLQIDTYQPETYRYGGQDALPFSEQIFHHDSEAAVALLEALSEIGDPNARWQLALHGMDKTLADFGLSLEHRLSLATAVRRDLGNELRGNEKPTRQRLAAAFRERLPVLKVLLDEDGRVGASIGEDLREGLRILSNRSNRMQAAVANIRSLAKEGNLSVAMGDLLASHIHMSINRLLPSAHRPHELVLYDFLATLYRGQLGRRRATGHPSQVEPQDAATDT